MLHIIK